MKNDNSHADNWGHVPGGESGPFWTDGRISYLRHCTGIFSLHVEGEHVLTDSFERIDRYAKAEFFSPAPGFGFGC